MNADRNGFPGPAHHRTVAAGTPSSRADRPLPGNRVGGPHNRAGGPGSTLS